MPGPTPLLGWGWLLGSPSIWPQRGGGFRGSRCGAEKGENWAQPQLFPAWVLLGKQRGVGGPHAGGEVPRERHCRS